MAIRFISEVPYNVWHSDSTGYKVSDRVSQSHDWTGLRKEQTRVVWRLGSGWFIYPPRVCHVDRNAPSDDADQVRHPTRDERGTAPGQSWL